MRPLAVVLVALAQAAPPAPPVVRVGVDVVQTDVVVTEADGRHVTDLTAADFEIVVDGRRSEITHCRYIEVPPAPPHAPSRPAAEDVRRVFAWIVDDNGLSLDSNDLARRALTKFVDEQMRPGDLVAIGRTGYGRSTRLLQQFTSDKKLLHAAIRDIHRNPASGGPPIVERGMTTRVLRAEHSGGGTGSVLDGASSGGYAAVMPPLVKLIETRQMMEGLGHIVTAMGTLPGRKALVLLSDRLSLIDGTVQRVHRDDPPVIDPGLLAGVHAVSELANRLAVVIHAVAPGGRHLFDGHTTPREQRRVSEGDGLSMLSGRTGGLYLSSGRDLSRAFARVVRDHDGYYVLGYTPDETLFDRKDGRAQFREMTVRVKRPGLTSRSRAGHLGVTDEEVKAAMPVGTQLTLAALSPLETTNLSVRMSLFFGYEPMSAGHRPGPALRALATIGGIAAGQTAALDVLALVLDATGTPVHEVDRSQMKVRPVEAERLQLQFDAPVRKAGAYQVRLAVRDTATARLGSAAGSLVVPDLDERKLALAGLSMGAFARPGERVPYTTIAYNVRLAPNASAPALETKARLLRDGRELAIGADTEIVPAETRHRPGAKLGHFAVAGRLPLDAALEPGRYVVELTVTDPLARRDGSAVAAAEIELIP